MKPDLALVSLVLLSALMHASWNAVVKADRDPLVTFAIVTFVGAVLGVLVAPFVPLPGQAAWPYLFLSAFFHFGYFICLLRAYAHGDLSQVYPISRGLGPLLVAALSGRLVGEQLSLTDSIGVLLVCGGIASLALAGGRTHPRSVRGALYAVANGVFIAAYTLADGLGVRAADDAVSYIVWLNLFEGPWAFVVALALRRGQMFTYLRTDWWRGTVGGLVATASYSIAVWAMSLGALAHVAALRETSVLFGALIGAIVLREGFGPRRVAAAALVAGGLLTMNLAA